MKAGFFTYYCLKEKMAQAFVITPYHPELWTEENIARFGEPQSSLFIKKSDLLQITRPHWHFDMGSLFIDGEYSLAYSLIDNQILRIAIFTAREINQFIHAYRQLISQEYDLYLFKEGNNDSLKLNLSTTVDEISNWTGFVI